jgi:hypothetical protein
MQSPVSGAAAQIERWGISRQVARVVGWFARRPYRRHSLRGRPAKSVDRKAAAL